MKKIILALALLCGMLGCSKSAENPAAPEEKPEEIALFYKTNSAVCFHKETGKILLDVRGGEIVIIIHNDTFAIMACKKEEKCVSFKSKIGESYCITGDRKEIQKEEAIKHFE